MTPSFHEQSTHKASKPTFILEQSINFHGGTINNLNSASGILHFCQPSTTQSTFLIHFHTIRNRTTEYLIHTSPAPQIIWNTFANRGV